MSKNIVILTVETYRGEKEAIMKKKVLKAGSAILALAIVFGAASILVKTTETEKENKKTSVNTYIRSIASKEVGIETKQEDQGYHILMNYPKTKNKVINQKLEEFSNHELSSFKDCTPEKDTDEKGSLFQSFETYEFSPDIVSFKFNVMRKSNARVQAENQVITKTYNLKENKELQLSDLFKDKDDLSSIAQNIYEKMVKLQENSNQRAKQVLSAGLQPMEKNFNAFILDNKCLDFFLRPGQVNSSTNLYTKVSVPLSELGEIVKPQILVGDLKEEAQHSKIKIPSAQQVQSKALAHKKLVALTFDDGPDPQTTPRLLSILKKANVPATFFVLGNRLELYPELVKKEHALGNQVGSHTYNHENLPQLPAKQAQDEIKKTSDLMQKTVGIRPQGLLPPYGATTPQINKMAQTPIIQWSVDSLDWESKNVDQIEQVVMNEVYDGSIILMHDIYDTSVDGAARVIQKLKNQGYTFVTVNQLIQARGKLENSHVYYNATQ
nr:polysaccharide deacetylase family protein [Lactococcus garvieae]